MNRKSGILLHPSSLPGPYGIGTLGEEAFRFLDFLSDAGQELWQVLPLGHTGYGDSPYQCFSAFAGNPLLIDPAMLAREGWITESRLEQHPGFGERNVWFGDVITHKYSLLREAYNTFHNNADAEQRNKFEDFCSSHSHWLGEYTLFMSLKDHFGGQPWYLWPDGIRTRRENDLLHYRSILQYDISLYAFLQYLFFGQWAEIKRYANERGISIIGDIPLYVAFDSADSWMHPELFLFDEALMPVKVAGVPPDYFSETGQLWGNPLYRWDYMKHTGFRWWIGRVQSSLELYDLVRIDHFRGLAAYWAVPFSEKTAVNGQWDDAPGRELLAALKDALGRLPLIAEDLGVITPDVEALRDDFGLPGMKVLQFAFDNDSGNIHIPYNFPINSVVYTGTHDNDTLPGWYAALDKSAKMQISDYLGITASDEQVCLQLIRLAWASTARIAIVPLQDLLPAGISRRMNIPGTAGGNWQWRFCSGDIPRDLAAELRELSKTYGRNVKPVVSADGHAPASTILQK